MTDYNAPPKNPMDNDPRTPNESIVDAMTADIKGIATEGMKNPAAKPVLTAAAIGAGAGLVLPFFGPVLGALGGAAFSLYNRNKTKA